MATVYYFPEACRGILRSSLPPEPSVIAKAGGSSPLSLPALPLQWESFTMNTNRGRVKRCFFDAGTDPNEITFGVQYMDNSSLLL